jgi:hypothetical protein
MSGLQADLPEHLADLWTRDEISSSSKNVAQRLRVIPFCRGGRDTGSYILRTRRGHSPSALVIESLNTVATKVTRAYLYGIQDNLFDFRDRTRLIGWARTVGRAMGREIPPKLRPELTPSLEAVSVVRKSR